MNFSRLQEDHRHLDPSNPYPNSPLHSSSTLLWSQFGQELQILLLVISLFQKPWNHQMPWSSQNSTDVPSFAPGQDPSVQQHLWLGYLQEEVNLRVWRYSHLCARSAYSLQPYTCLRICSKTCWRSSSKDQESWISHRVFKRISSNWNRLNTVLNLDLNPNIIRSLPIELQITFNDKYTVFINLDANNNIYSPAVFKFLNKYVENLNNSYKANPMFFDIRLSPMNVGIKLVHYEVPKKQKRKSNTPARNNQERPHRPCPLCSIKDFKSDHFPLSWRCGGNKLSSVEIIKTMDNTKVCPSSISIANLPSWMAPTGSALRTAPTRGFPWTSKPANTTLKPHPSPSSSWGPTSLFPWFNSLKRTCPHLASNMTWVPKSV